MIDPTSALWRRTVRWRQSLWRWIGLLVAGTVTFIMVRNAVLNVFYTTGDMHDPGWLASVDWHTGPGLRGPAGFPGPYFAEHVAPVMWFTDAISYLVPLSRYEHYAACIAVSHALFAAGICRAWQLTEPRQSAAGTVVAILVALAAAFSGVAVEALGLPHPELAIPATALWLLIALARRANFWAAFWLTACLSIREDAGLHVFALLTLWIGVTMTRQRSVPREVKLLAGFALAALSYSALAFAAKRLEFPGDDVFARSYPGVPAWHHVNRAFVLDRLNFYLLHRLYILLPMLATCIWAALSRNPLLPLGYIAELPWLVLAILAFHSTPGTVAYYYGFPFWLSLGWPLIALCVWQRSDGGPNRRWPYALVLLCSLVGWRQGRLVVYPLQTNVLGESQFAYNDTVRDRARYQEFVGYFLAHRAVFGTLALDAAVYGLMIDHTGREVWMESWKVDRPPETMMFFPGALEWQPYVLPMLQTGLYQCIYEVPGTRIQVATQATLSDRLPAPMPMRLIKSSLGARC